tara:strand:+ start:25218 stop:25805 length:588 start_codon:yes stop_codon:yes gene_type:complete
MLNTLTNIYNDLLVATAAHNVFSLQVVISVCYVLAFGLSIVRALKNTELLSDFLCIAVVGSKYMLTTLLMEHVLMFLADTQRGDLAQNVYLALCGFNLLSVYVLYKLHTRFSYKYGPLFFTVVRLTLVLALAHFAVWVKFVVLDIQEGFAVMHYAYSFIVLYISVALGVLMVFPRLLFTRFGRFMSLQFSGVAHD